MSAIFTHSDEQKRLARETLAREEARRGAKIHTEILPYTGFWVAEDYHQKFELRQNRDLSREFERIYADPKALMNSTAAARVNAYLGGHGTRAQLEAELPSLGLSPEAQRALLRRIP